MKSPVTLWGLPLEVAVGLIGVGGALLGALVAAYVAWRVARWQARQQVRQWERARLLDAIADLYLVALRARTLLLGQPASGTPLEITDRLSSAHVRARLFAAPVNGELERLLAATEAYFAKDGATRTENQLAGVKWILTVLDAWVLGEDDFHRAVQSLSDVSAGAGWERHAERGSRPSTF